MHTAAKRENFLVLSTRTDALPELRLLEAIHSVQARALVDSRQVSEANQVAFKASEPLAQLSRSAQDKLPPLKTTPTISPST